MPREVGIRVSNVVQKLERPITPSYEADITQLYIAGRKEGVAKIEFFHAISISFLWWMHCTEDARRMRVSRKARRAVVYIENGGSEAAF